MSTIINNPNPDPVVHERVVEDRTDRGSGFLLGVILLIAFLAFLFWYGLPALRNATNSGGTNINVPDDINVNVNPGGGAGEAPQGDQGQ